MSKLKKLIHKAIQTVPTDLTLIKISWLWTFIALIGLYILNQEQFLKGIYVDENALLIDHAWVYYNDVHVRIAESHQISLSNIKDLDSQKKSNYLINEFKELGFVAYSQKFDIVKSEFQEAISGVNTYAILKAPRGDGTEALVLSADWKSNEDGKDNIYGVSLLLSIANRFSTSNFWAKDIIFLITDGGLTATNAWLEAYFSSVPKEGIESLQIIGSEIQLALSLDFPNSKDGYDSLSFHFDGPNGHLPNMDLIATVGAICDTYQLEYRMYEPPPQSLDKTFHGLFTMFSQLKNMALCLPSTFHGLFLNYGVSVLTLKGNESEKGFIKYGRLGWAIESTFRSLNNLLERLHHSTHFYLYTSSHHYIPLSHYIVIVILLGVLPFLLAFLKVRKLNKVNQVLRREMKNNNNKEGIENGEGKEKDKAVSNSADEKEIEYVDEQNIPQVTFSGGFYSLFIYILCLNLSLIALVLLTTSFDINVLVDKKLDIIIGISYGVILIIQYIFIRGNSDALKEAQLIALAFSSLISLFVSPLNSGLSLLISISTLPYTLFIIHLNNKLIRFISTILVNPISWMLVATHVLKLDWNWNALFGKHLIVHSWLPLTMFLSHGPLNLVSFLITFDF